MASLAGLPKGVIRRAKTILKSLEDENRHLSPCLSPAYINETENEDANKPKPVLNEVLKEVLNEVLEEIKDLDINNLSPLMALNQISRWQKELLEDRENE